MKDEPAPAAAEGEAKAVTLEEGALPLTPEGASTHSSVAQSSRASRSSLVFSLTGLIPLGAFLVLHLWINHTALRGQREFAMNITKSHALALAPAAEALLLFLPLLVHGAWGLYLVATRSAVRAVSPYPAGVRTAMRVTGVMLVVYALYHLYQYRLGVRASGIGPEHVHSILTARLSTTWHGVPVVALVDATGLGAATFHFAAGAYGFVVATAKNMSAGARKVASILSGVLFAVLFTLGMNTLVYFTTGSRFLGPAEPTMLPLDNAVPCSPMP